MSGLFRVKICGITNTEDADHAVECGADALGFVFFAESPRCVTPEQACRIIETLPGEVTTVGLFVNEAAETITKTIDAAGIDLVQLHGDESPEFCRELGHPHIKALRVRDTASLADWGQYPSAAILLDAWHPEKFGGTGNRCDWALAADLAARTTIVLAGGLSPDNIADAVTIVKPYAVDVSSGVELKPGKKDPEKVAAFIARARERLS